MIGKILSMITKPTHQHPDLLARKITSFMEIFWIRLWENKQHLAGDEEEYLSVYYAEPMKALHYRLVLLSFLVGYLPAAFG